MTIQTQVGKYHSELIWCPSCKEVQLGSILEAYPFAIYVYDCVECGYVITESEWNPVVKDTDLLTDVDVTIELIKRGLSANPYYTPDKAVCEKAEWFMASIPDSDIMETALNRGMLLINRV